MKKCHKCGNTTTLRDGVDVGGMPGIIYDYCNACGWSRAITKKPTKQEVLASLRALLR